MGAGGNTREDADRLRGAGRVPSPGEVADRLACSDVLEAYVTAVDTRDWDLLAGLLTDDARLDYTSSGGPAGGHADVVGWLEAGLSGFEVTQHMLATLRIVVDGDSASARPYLINPMGAGELNFLLAGSYRIELRRVGEAWRIAGLVQQTRWTQGIDRSVIS